MLIYRRFAVLGLLIVAGNLIGANGSYAAAVTCPPGAVAWAGLCSIEVVGRESSSSPSEVASNEGEGFSPACKNDEGAEVPCTSDLGAWNGTCYIKAVSPQPPRDDPAWQGRTDGLIVTCALALDGGGLLEDGVAGVQFWVPSLPGAGPSPRELADRAVEEIGFRAGRIGMTPLDGGSGVVGVPTYLWVADPGTSTTGPVARTVSAGGTSVTATGRLEKVVYAMGDGATVTCHGPGTPYEPAFGGQPSPDCGHTYTTTSTRRPGGAFVVTATSHWTVEWNGGGQSGTIPLEFSRSVRHEVGEMQVLVTR